MGTQQPYAHAEPNVSVKPSQVHNLGLWTNCAMREGDTVCLYTGECVKCVEGNKSKYLLEVFWKNPESNVLETWYLDSTQPDNAAGRYINDARGTGFDYNVGFLSLIHI